MSKMNVAIVVADHLRTLRNFGDDSIGKTDLASFYALPVIASVALAYLGFGLERDVAGVLLVSLFVFAGLLLGLLVLIREIGIELHGAERSKRELQLAREVCCNISYAALVSLVGVVVLTVTLVVSGQTVGVVGSVLALALFGHLFLTLLMITKRVHVLVGSGLSSPDE